MEEIAGLATKSVVGVRSSLIAFFVSVLRSNSSLALPLRSSGLPTWFCAGQWLRVLDKGLGDPGSNPRSWHG